MSNIFKRIIKKSGEWWKEFLEYQYGFTNAYLVILFIILAFLLLMVSFFVVTMIFWVSHYLEKSKNKTIERIEYNEDIPLISNK
jgi:uncharacterized membrane protein